MESSKKYNALEKKLVENESKMKSSEGVSEKVASLTRDLQLSEERLKEAEEIAWKSKAEASEIVYAMEQEQASVKKLSTEVEVMKAKAEQDSLKHAETLKDRDLEVEVEQPPPHKRVTSSQYISHQPAKTFLFAVVYSSSQKIIRR
jgi:hypothetical protein